MTTRKPSRRTLLKSAAGGVAGAALGGFPTIWAQNIKDITLNEIGGSFSAINAIAVQAKKDLGFNIHMQAAAGDDLMNRMLAQPESIDLVDAGSTTIRYMIGRGALQGIPVKKMKYWGEMVPIFTKGTYPNGTPCSLEGCSPFSVQFTPNAALDTISATPTDYITNVPTLFNADTLGIRPDLVGRKITSWADLLSPEFKGRAALVDSPTVGVIDVALACEAAGKVKYRDKGNMSRPEIDATIGFMKELKRNGHFRAFWTTFDQSVNLMASGEVVIQSMWSPAVTAVRARGIDCEFVPLKEGYRGWAIGLSIMKHLTGLKYDCAIEYMNWYLSGWQGAFIARQGYYSPVLSTVKAALTEDEWGYWYDGKPSVGEIHDPFGKVMEKPGRVRDGGAVWDRMGHIAVWNSVMDEDRYLTRKWNEFVTS